MANKSARQKTHLEIYRCACGFCFPIQRKSYKAKKMNHPKDLWCLTCKERTTFRLDYSEARHEIFRLHTKQPSPIT